MTYTRRIALLVLVGLLLSVSVACRKNPSFMLVTSEGYCFVFDEMPKTCDLSKLKGTFVNGRYYDAEGFFSVEIPYLFRANIAEFPEKLNGRSTTIFDSRLGEKLTVHAAAMSEKQYANWYLSHFASHKTLRVALHHYLDSFEIFCPSFEVVEEEDLGEGDNIASFALVKMPEASMFTNDKTGRNLDSYAGYLLFCDDSQFVLLVMETPVGSCKEANRKQWLIDELNKLRESYRNESCAGVGVVED